MVNWSWIGLFVSIVTFVVLIVFKKFYKGGKHLFKWKLVKNKVIQFATPHRLELILVALYLGFFFVSDLAQNKVIDLGRDYKVIVFWNITAPALLVWEVFLILFHIVLISLFILSLQSKATSRTYDVTMGVIALFGVAILFAGVVNQFYSPTIYFLGLTLESIDFYHLGVYIEMAYALYLVFTK